MRKRKEYEFTIETTEFPGKGIAIYEGERVGIKGAIPGQKVRARVTKKNSNGIEAKLLEVLEDVDYKTDDWGDGAWTDCPECGKEVELDNYEYD